MTRQKAFETAAARRRKNPIVWQVDDQQIRIRPNCDLADLQRIVDAVQEQPDEDDKPMLFAERKRTLLAETIAEFVVFEDSDAWAGLQDDLDLVVLVEMATDLMMEFTGQGNPTLRSDSSEQSPEPGPSSTDGVPVEDSTPSA